jgi:hypothetical protein
VSSKKHKQPASIEIPSGQKLPKSASLPSLYDDRKASWRMSRVQLSDPYGWHQLSVTELADLKSKLATFERNTWKELFVRDAKWNHRIDSNQVKCPIARQWMQKNMPDEPYLWTLRLSNKERIWGILSEGAYQIVFWDPNHLIWEVALK